MHRLASLLHMVKAVQYLNQFRVRIMQNMLYIRVGIWRICLRQSF